jgi:hypothetical protein
MLRHSSPDLRVLALLLALPLGGLAGCGGRSSSSAAGAGMTSAIDKSRCSDQGKQVATSDTNDDKRPDVYKFYSKGSGGSQVMTCKQVDLNHDGKVDIVYHYGEDAALTFEEFDLDFDNRFDLRAFYQGGRKVREEMDTNYDQRVDFTKYYEADRLVRIERDANNDGRVDEWMYYEGGKLDRIGYDSSGSGRVDRWERAPDAESAPTEGGTPAGPVPAGGAPPGATPTTPASSPTTPGATAPAAPPAAPPAPPPPAAPPAAR